MSGSGVHPWLFSMARQLHAHMTPEQAIARLALATANCGRSVPLREIRNAVDNSEAVAWKRGEKSLPARPRAPIVRSAAQSATPDPRAGWPAADALARELRAGEMGDEVTGLYDLSEKSPVRCEGWTPDDWLDYLFPNAAWLCLAVDHPSSARSRKREQWMFGPADECGLVVPSPMTGPSGIGLDGSRSHRCLGNTAPRRWLVIEWDQHDGKPISIDEQAALHWHLRASALENGSWPKLTLVVHSGGKSLHGWYGPVTSEDAAHELMAYAVSLCADPATWVRCQLVRLPGGVREHKSAAVPHYEPDGWTTERPAKAMQSVYYFEPQ